MVKIAVLGAGINGVGCAFRIKEKYKEFDVVLISESFSPQTTGDGSGGLWYPYLCGDTPEDQLNQWGGETYKYYHSLWLHGGYSVSMMPIYALYTAAASARAGPGWPDSVFGYRELGLRELEYVRSLYNGNYIAGHTFTTFVVTPSAVISHLQSQFTQIGGRILEAKVTSLRDPVLKDYDVVVNCCGLGAREIVPDDQVLPIRGQILRVSAPWVNYTISEHDSGHYIIPNINFCVMGGTHQENDFNRNIDPKDTEFIVNGCTTIIPSLKNAKVLNEWVGLRPGRPRVRVEPEHIDGKLYIHNYGHGGSGLTLFQGCATQVLQMLDSNLNRDNITKSKL